MATETELRAQIYELAQKLVPAKCTFKSRRITLYRNYLPKRKFVYRAVIGIAWHRPRSKNEGVQFVEFKGGTTREAALSGLVAELKRATKDA